MSIIFKHNPHDGIRITSPFGYRKAPTAGATTYHEGIDIGAIKAGIARDKIYSVADGTIVVNKANKGNANTGYGWYVVIEHNGFCTLYAHLKQQSNLKVGTKVKAGDVIGYMGETGTATGVHLHFGLKNCSYNQFWSTGKFINPQPYLIQGGSKIMDVKTAINILVKNGVISSPDYWIDASNIVKYLPELLINMANKLN